MADVIAFAFHLRNIAVPFCGGNKTTGSPFLGTIEIDGNPEFSPDRRGSAEPLFVSIAHNGRFKLRQARDSVS